MGVTSMHLDDERVQRLLHGELEPDGERLAGEHLAGCDVCRRMVDEARADESRIFGLLREVDHPLPAADPRVILAAAGSPRSRWELWAAGVLLATAAAGAAYAAPGSPLPAAFDRLAAILAPSRPQVGNDPAASDAAPLGAGVALLPGDRLAIRFAVETGGAVAILSLTDGKEAVVHAVEGAATFSSDVNRLLVRSPGPARFEILIPRSAPWVEVLSGDTPVFRKRNGDVVADAEPGADGRYRLTLSSPAP